jgi:ubiquinone/menaquinone biosynthesis C-methylase UbiE
MLPLFQPEASSMTAIATATASATAVDHTFEWFSSLPRYRDINRLQIEDFLSGLALAPPWQGIDVACGVGLMSELCHEVAAKIGAFIQRTICVDLDRGALDLAREKLAHYPVAFLQSLGQRLPLRDGQGSFLVLGNGIHMFGAQEKVDLFHEAFRVLRRGSGLFFNSAFYQGSVVEGTEPFYTDDKIRRAMRDILRSKQPASAADEKPEAARQITPQEYVSLAQEAGFTDVQHHEAELRADLELWEAICDYGPYAQGALHYRYPAAVACGALQRAVREVFGDPNWNAKYPGMEDNGRRFIPRRWLWVTARKP